MKKEKLYPRYKWRYLVQQACQKRHPQAPFMAEREATCVRTAPIRCWRDIGCMQLVQTSRDAASDVSGPRPHGSEVVSWRPRVLPLR